MSHDGPVALGDTLDVAGATRLAGTLAVNGNVTLGDASTDVIALTGRVLIRQVTDAGMDATPGTKVEMVYNTADDKVYVCTVTHATAATWVALN
jgi:hypothetical protein